MSTAIYQEDAAQAVLVNTRNQNVKHPADKNLPERWKKKPPVSVQASNRM